MPLYDYECRGCGHRFEALVRPSSPAVCPSCQGQDLEQLLSLFAVSSDGTRQLNLKAATATGDINAAHLLVHNVVANALHRPLEPAKSQDLDRSNGRVVRHAWSTTTYRPKQSQDRINEASRRCNRLESIQVETL